MRYRSLLVGTGNVGMEEIADIRRHEGRVPLIQAEMVEPLELDDYGIWQHLG